MKNKKMKKIKYILMLLTFAVILGIFLIPSKLYLTVDSFSTKVDLKSTFSVPTYKACVGRKYLKKYFKCYDVTNNIKVVNDVNNKKAGKYNLEFKYKNETISYEKKYEIEVIDKIAPVITLAGGDATICRDDEYIEPGYVAIDDNDGDITSSVTVKKENNIVTYSVKDSSGNETRVERKIIKGDNKKPVIKLQGNAYININIGETYKEPGYTANDNCDGDITKNVVINGKVDNSKAGTYKISYCVKDKSSNETCSYRIVIVSEKNTINPVPSHSSNKTIYLTFDDGPGAATSKLLDVLKKYNVKATFFVTNQFPKYKYLIKRAYEEGHTIGLHTYTHKWDIYNSMDSYFDDLNKINEVVKEQTGNYAKYIRFPGGTSNRKANYRCKGLMVELSREVIKRGFEYYDWNVSSGDADSKKISTAKVAQNVINGIKGSKSSYIVLQHDYKSFSVAAVEEIIKYGLSHGYKFAKIDDNTPKIRFNPRS